jgi:hypothetical protein
MSKRILVGLIPSGLVTLCIAGPSLAASPHSSKGSAANAIPDVTVLFSRGVNKIRNTKRPTFSRAVVVEADGITRGGRCTPMGCSGGRGTTTVSGIVSWRFVFNNQASRTRFQSATLTYGPPPKAFGNVIGYKPAFVQDVDIPRAPRMTLGQALVLLRRAGHRGVFFNVALRNPVGPKKSNPLYIFGFANRQFFAVDTVTKRVKSFG